MTEHRFRYAFSPPADPSGSGQREWQSSQGRERRSVGQDGLNGRYPFAAAKVTQTAVGESTSPTQEIVESLSSQATSQQQLYKYHATPARDVDYRDLPAQGVVTAQSGKKRIFPVLEESAVLTSPIFLADPTATSTESSHISHGGMTPAAIAHPPSYPFPRMTGFIPYQIPKYLPYQHASAPPRQQTSPAIQYRCSLDKVLPEKPTPTSDFTFEPTTGSNNPSGFDFPAPNIYDLSLMLSAEPGLDAWWNTVVQIMRDIYQAERVTLAIPADATDIENVPWGQKATYNGHPGDDLSLDYLAKASSAFRNSDYEASDGLAGFDDTTADSSTSSRTCLRSRHSYTAFEEDKQKSQDRTLIISRKRPVNLTRSMTQYPSPRVAADLCDDYTKLSKAALDEHNAAAETVQEIPSWEAAFMGRYEGQGRVLPVLQALDYEADPLINHTDIMRVLERGRPVYLTRTYPYLPRAKPDPEQAANQKPSSKGSSKTDSKWSRKQRSDSPWRSSALFARTSHGKGSSGGGKLNTIALSLNDENPTPPDPKYEEYEQVSLSPSPAVRVDPKEKLFFTDAMVDEKFLKPDSPPAGYAAVRPPEAIGVGNSWTVLHIPLTHALLSKPTRAFKLDATALKQKFQSLAKDECLPDRKVPPEADRVSGQSKGNRPAPIAILSILSPIIPYPSNLRRSLEHLAPHMATSFSLCRHYTNLETELAGMHRRRPSTTGFGAVAPFGSHVESGSYLASGHAAQQNSLGGSITSPSDYSAISKSATASPLATPAMEHGSRNSFVDRRQPLGSPSPGSQAVGSYFANKQTQAPKQDILTPGTQGSRIESKANSPREKWHSSLSGVRFGNEAWSPEPMADRSYIELRESTMKTQRGVSSSSGNDGGVADSPSEATSSKLRDLGRADHGYSPHGHTVLHSYGADFASTFQSLPLSSSLSSRMPPTPTGPPRRGSLIPMAGEMPPPSDRLKGLILDSLPAHVFVSLPQTGETVWVNSRFLSYRGQTVADLSADPWGNIHSDDRDGYLKAWGHSLRTGEQFSKTVRIKRFDGAYRWFYARAVASKNKRGVIMQFLGSYMDIHDQHIAELKAARREEIEASEAKHRLLANLIPQIIFAATDDDGVTFANDQWLSYTGQNFEDSLGLGFMDFVHTDDLLRCSIPSSKSSNADTTPDEKGSNGASSSGTMPTPTAARTVSQPLPQTTAGKWPLRDMKPVLSGASSSDSESIFSLTSATLTELARKGIIKTSTDTNGRLSYTTEVRLRAKTGEYRWHLIRCVEIDTLDFGHGASSYFGSATDINDHKLLEAKLKDAMESKGRFLSNMSHEIRTPLIGISGMVSFLQDTTLDEEQRDYTNTIQNSANSLIMIINDILDLSKADAGMMKLKHEWFHPRSLMEDVNELLSTMAIAKHLELNYLVEADVPAWVKGDKVRIRQVLLNVIGNAIKFTAEGEVFSRCKVYAEDDSALRNEGEIMLQFAITDTGRGFSEDEAKLIFKPFSQIDGSSTRQHGGSGLGLVISRQLVELHGGKMEGTALPGKGSTFTFTARFTLSSAEGHPDIPPSPSSTTGSASASASSRHGSSEAIPRTDKGEFAMGQLRGSPKEGTSPRGTEAKSSPRFANISSSFESSGRLPSYVKGSSPVTCNNSGQALFSEAAKVGGQDMPEIKLEMSSDRGSPPRASTLEVKSPRPTSDLRPLLYSILVICPQHHSREATTQHIEMTLPKDVPHQITAIGTIEEAQPFIGGENPIRFTHVVLNLSPAEAIINAMDQILKSQKTVGTTTVILSNPAQRQTVQKLATDKRYGRLFSGNLVIFIYKPVKPSRFAFVFDPDKVRDLSTDRNRSTAQQMIENQRVSYQEIEKRMGNKGYRVLLVEDNLVNQKVLNKYLKKIGVEVEVAVDGVECIETVLSKPHEYYSLILCDLHMPRKDGYQACREIREWEKASKLPKLPIIALSANVMSDVQDKCVAAGFSDYLTKPVNFIDLSRAMAKFFK